MDNSIAKAFNLFFTHKGNTAPIAEKADRNFLLKTKSNINQQQRIYYFAIGHVFKQLDSKSIFDYTVDEKTGETIVNKFKWLREDKFTFINNLEKLIGNIRNLNSHYIHDFSVIKLDVIDSAIINFLKEAFELAIIHTYIQEKNMKYDEYIQIPNNDKLLVSFLCDKFHPFNVKKNKDGSKKILTKEEQENENKYIEFRKEFKNKTKTQAIDAILFIENITDYEWTLYETHNIFKITEGKYLSFYGCLFLLTMFLYKGEANQLISKIKGFKLSDKDVYRSKRSLFSFYSKKFGSQDIDSEESHLIKFRDIVQYLNKYPKHWNNELELQPQIPVMSNLLKDKIVDMEIERCYPKFAGNQKFNQFVKYKLFTKKELKDDDYILHHFTTNEISDFNFEILFTKEYKDLLLKKDQINTNKKLNDYKKQEEHRKIDFKIKKEGDNLNKDTEKLKTRIAKNLLYVQYGRNQDRFMDFAVRFLAEKKYFGSDVEFKMYQYYSSEEQDTALIELRKTKTKKEFDKLKFHQGKLVHYSTFENHLQNYPTWDTPFVFENNAFQIKINFNNQHTKIVLINRTLLIYLLEHALFNPNIENEGRVLLTDYFNEYNKEFTAKKQTLTQQATLTAAEKTEYKKLFPKRLLHNYCPPIEKTGNATSSLQQILENAKKSEERYNLLLNKVKEEEQKYKKSFPEDDTVRLVEYFLKRNKGKQFKLQFIRKACHLMFFKDLYLEQSKEAGHHKRFHINKEEFNNFSKWMFAFDEVPVYKKFLNQLFIEKGFYKNTEFKLLFETSKTLDELYTATKEIYTNWLENNTAITKDENRYQLKNYEKLFADETFLINTSHFIKYLENTGILKRNTEGNLKYQSLENEKYLITAYYYKEKLEKSEYKTCGKLYNKLKTNKLEDALLYQIAMDYLATDKTIVKQIPVKVNQLLTQDITFEIKDKTGNYLFNLIVPFSKLMSYEELKNHKVWQENEPKFRNTSFLANIILYLKKVQYNKDIRSVYEFYNKIPSKPVLLFEHLNTIYNHIIANSSKFTKVELELENYFIFVKKLTIKKDNRITYEDITDLKKYFSEMIRNKAFHFGVPTDSYDITLKEIEKKFITNEVKPKNPVKFDDLSKEIKNVCIAFLETVHNDYYDFREKDSRKKKADATEKYFREIIKK